MSNDEMRIVVISEHGPPDCCPNTCDVAIALDMGMPDIAAGLLLNYGSDYSDTIQQIASTVSSYRWAEWHTRFIENTRECLACGSYPPTKHDYCGNCGHQFEEENND